MLEALVSLALIGLVLAVVAGMMASVSGSWRFSERQDRGYQAAYIALDSIRSEVQAAVELLDPLPGSTAPTSSLRLQRMAGDYLFPEPPYPSPPGWDWSAVALDEVVYRIVGGQMTREVVAENSRSLVPEAAGFSCRFLADGNLEVALNLGEGQALTTEVFKP